ncbi:MAG TPA: hypothetical protein VNU66_09505 [Mycobacteriales bacterium]|nr:hypothetical protein [Mycobacteriales bacterium]
MDDDRLERAYARLEAQHESRRAATARRGPVSLVAVCLGVALVVGVTAAVDLRRLRTPEGTAVAWTGAAVYGDCTGYRELGTIALDDRGCRDLRDATEEARERPDVDVAPRSARVTGDRAEVAVVLVRGDDEQRLAVPLVRRDGRWAVDPDDALCAAVYCPGS